MAESQGAWRGWEPVLTSPRAYLLAGASAGLFVGGLFLSQPFMFASIPVVLLVGFMALRSVDPRADLEIVRTAEKVRIREGESAKIRLRVTNRGLKRVSFLQVRDAVGPGLQGPRTRAGFSFPLGPGESRDVYYEVYGNTFGVHTLGPVTVLAQDSTGLFQSRTEFKAYSKVVVFPEATERLAHFPIRPHRTKSWPGEITSNRTGTGLNYFSIREFIPGESLRRINWRASARRPAWEDGFLVNEYNAELGAEVLIIVDAGRLMDVESRDPMVAHSARAALSISERLLRDRNRVGLLTTGSNARRVPAAYGRRQFDKIALSLLQIEPGESDIRWWVERSIRLFFPTASQVIFVSALMNANSLSAAAEITRFGGLDVIIVTPNPLTLGDSAAAPTSREWSIARRMARLEREADLDRLRDANALVIDWTTSSSLEEVMEVHRRAMARHASVAARRG